MIKSNRVLGTRLVEAGLTNVEDMDQANEIFIGLARQKDIRRASLLRIMIYDKQSLKEESLIDYQLENHHVGAVMLENYKLNKEIHAEIPLELMRASWTLPIDKVNGHWFLATAYYMSDVVREYWQDLLDGRITWYVSPLNQLESVFDSLLEEEAAAAVEDESDNNKD